MAVKDDVFVIVEPITRELGIDLVEVEYVKEGPRWFVRVYLHKADGGITLEDCRAVNDALGPALEAADPVKTPYNLEISSPGAERVLKAEREFHIFQGRLVKVTLREPHEGEHAVYGNLGPATEHTLHITTKDGQSLGLDRPNIKQIRLALQGVPSSSK